MLAYVFLMLHLGWLPPPLTGIVLLQCKDDLARGAEEATERRHMYQESIVPSPAPTLALTLTFSGLH